MKKALMVFSMVVLLAGPLQAINDPFKYGMQLYQKHRYEEAADVLYSYISTADSSRQGKAYLGLAMTCLANAKLYEELYRVSIAIHLDYLTRLLTVESRYKSHMVNLYLGRTLLEAGQLSDAAASFRKFLTDNKVARQDKDLAQIKLGAAYFLQGEHHLAHDLWSKVNGNQPELLMSLAAAYSSVGLTEKKPVAMCQDALKRLQRSGKTLRIQVINDLISVYTRAGHVDDVFELIKRANLRVCFHQESPVKNKVIQFYDPALLGNLSSFHGNAALRFLEKASATGGKKLKDLARYYLGEAHGLYGSPDQSQKIVDEFISSAGINRQFKNKARVRQAVNHYILGNKKAGARQFDDLVQFSTEPDLMAEMLLACVRHKIESPQVVIKASAMAQKRKGRQYARLNFALGKYYLGKKDYAKAISYMEAGRDKSNKNRIEFNDPLMLVNLAEAYYRAKQYSEALEIFFEMSKQFPAVRQIQVSLQGVYSMEQKSAGDVKIF